MDRKTKLIRGMGESDVFRDGRMKDKYKKWAKENITPDGGKEKMTSITIIMTKTVKGDLSKKSEEMQQREKERKKKMFLES